MNKARKRPVIIGMSGGSGVGKTTICQHVSQHSRIPILLLSHDSYYKCLSHLPAHARGRNNFDHPAAFDNDLLCEHLSLLKQAKPVDVPEYDFATHTRTGKVTRFYPAEIVMVEGIMLFADPQIRDCFDHKIFVDLDPDIRFIRRLKRDVKERGRSVDSVIDQYLATVKPMHDEYVDPAKHYADIIINGDDKQAAVRKLIDYIHANIQTK